MIGGLYDRLQFVLLSVNESLVWAADKNFAYKVLLPENPLKYLSIKNNLSPDQIFFIVRPSIQPLYSYTKEEFNNKIAEA